MARNCESVTFSLPATQARMIRIFRKEGGNPSALIQGLIAAHFSVGSDADEKLIRDAVTIATATEQLKKIEEEQEKLRQLLARNTAEVEKKVEIRKDEKERQNVAVAVEKRTALEETIRQIFTEMEEGGLTCWREVAGGEALLMQYAHVRVGVVATRAGISEAEAKAAVLRVYPDLGGYLCCSR